MMSILVVAVCIIWLKFMMIFIAKKKISILRRNLMDLEKLINETKDFIDEIRGEFNGDI